MLKLEVDNFLGITHAELEDESAFSVIVGPNNSGKSSLASAVEYVFTGGACSLRGQAVSKLIRQGRTRMKVSLVGFANSVAICSLVDRTLERAGLRTCKRGRSCDLLRIRANTGVMHKLFDGLKHDHVSSGDGLLSQ